MASTQVSDNFRKAPAIDLPAVFFFVGTVLCGFGAAMLLPALIDAIDGNLDYRVFVTCSAIAIFVGLSMALAFRAHRNMLGIREVMLTAPAAWLTIVAFCALPFVFSSFRLSYTDAVFETMSGISATGSTVIIGLDTAPAGLLLWRWLLIWFGGFGFITLAVLVLPFLRIGGLQLFVLDLSVQSAKFVPRMIDLVIKLGLIYVGITAVGAFAFRLEGMSVFDAIGHSMAAVATGGFSSHDASIGWFNSPAIEWTASLLMVVSALPFVLHLEALRRGPQVLFRDEQVRLFLSIIALAIASLFLWRVVAGDAPLIDAAREATFNVASIISTTGFTSQDFDKWGGFPPLLLLVMMLVGGCTGSTAGGIKMFRLRVLIETLRVQTHRQIYPHGTFVVNYNGQPVTDAVRAGVALYFFVYLTTFFTFAMLLAFCGVPFEASLGGSATALGGVGPGLGPIIGPCCTFAPLPDAAKWLLAIEMLAGRLEILILVIPLTRTFWRT
ncbi:MAG: TrkH family potassium uptake protein [Rhodospirillales bacterium]|nr:TrkH family potassium uptake protein [Rhodospirillales bacterium]